MEKGKLQDGVVEGFVKNSEEYEQESLELMIMIKLFGDTNL